MQSDSNLRFFRAKRKFRIFKLKDEWLNSLFTICGEEEFKHTIKKELLDLKSEGFDNYREHSSIKTWRRIEESGGFPFLSRLAKVCFSLSTTSADVENLFSLIKLYYTYKRNSLRENTLESIILISQEFSEVKIEINENMKKQYQEIKLKLNARKSKSNQQEEENNDATCKKLKKNN